jgi:DHA1 family multidrug resistance protein-like MFS transporter
MPTQHDSRKEVSNNLGQMYGVGLMAFVLFLSTLVGLPVLPQLSTELGAGATEIPIVVSAALATVVIAQFFTGILADRYSKRTLILIGALLGSVSSLLCVVATHWTQLAVLRVIGGIADAIAMPALLAITASLGTEQPGKFFGILRSSQGLSFVVGPVLGSVFSLISLRTPFIVDGGLSLLAFLAAIVLLKDTGQVKSEHELNLFRGLRLTFADRRVYLYLLMGISGLFGFGILFSFIPTKAQLIGLEAWQIGLILGGGAVIFSFVSYAIGTLSDRFGRRMFVVVSQIIIAVAGIGFFFSNGFVGLSLFYGLFCVGDAITYLLCFVYATEVFDQRYIGTSMGAFDSVMDLSLFVGPLIAVSVYKSSAQIGPIFLIAVVPAMLAFLATAMWLPRSSASMEVATQ